MPRIRYIPNPTKPSAGVAETISYRPGKSATLNGAVNASIVVTEEWQEVTDDVAGVARAMYADSIEVEAASASPTKPTVKPEKVVIDVDAVDIATGSYDELRAVATSRNLKGRSLMKLAELRVALGE